MFLLFAGFHGQIYIYKSSKQSIVLTNAIKIENVERLYSFHWLTCNSFLTCQNNGNLSLWFLENNKICEVAQFILPPCKERFTTTAHMIDKAHLVVGDRKGNIHLFIIGRKHPIQSLKRAHSHLGVTQLLVNEHTVISLGEIGFRYMIQVT